MKKFLATSIASISLVACTTNPTMTSNADHRNPAFFRESSEAVVASANNAVHASVEFSQGSVEGSKQVSQSLWNSLKSSVNTAKDVAIVGWFYSREASGIVLASIEDASEFSTRQANRAITASGEVFEASVDASRSAIGVSVEVIKDSGKVIVRSGKFILGQLENSIDFSKDAAIWSGDQSANAARWSVDKSGQLIHSSGKVFGFVVDQSKKVVGFALDKSGKILTFSYKASVAVVHGTSEGISSIAQAVKEGLVDSSNFITAQVIVSGKNTVMVLKWSARGVNHSWRVFSNEISKIIHSEPVPRMYESGQGG